MIACIGPKTSQLPRTEDPCRTDKTTRVVEAGAQRPLPFDRMFAHDGLLLIDCRPGSTQGPFGFERY